MNAGKSFMSFGWEPFMKERKEICKEFGFVSENAQMYAKKGSDHHKPWDILENKLLLLFFDRNHLHFHQLMSYEKRIEVLMPHEVRVVKFTSLVLSRTGRVRHYQSGDAIMRM